MRNSMEKKVSFTVGIPTYYGGPGLVKTVQSVLAFRDVQPFRLIVCVDGKPLQRDIGEQLKKMGAEIVLSEIRGGQLERIKQMIGLCETDILFLTQDDILFTPETVREVMKKFEEDESVTMVCGNAKPLPPKNFFESVFNVGLSLADTIGAMWNDGDNHLRVGGRCLALRMDMARKMDISEGVLSSDAYFYFYNRLLGGKFAYANEAIYFLRSPNNLSEHLKQSRKYQLIRKEISAHLSGSDSVPSLPVKLILLACWKEFLRQPIRFLAYIAVLMYTRCAGRNLYKDKVRFWDTDISTKQI